MKIKGRNLVITEEYVSIEISEVRGSDSGEYSGTCRYIARLEYNFQHQLVQVNFSSGLMSLSEWKVANQAVETFSKCMSASPLPASVRHLSKMFDEIE